MSDALTRQVSSAGPSIADREQILRVLTCQTELSASGQPFISLDAFRSFNHGLSYLFRAGSELLDWLSAASSTFRDAQGEHFHISRSAKVVAHLIKSAAICAPSDLWMALQLLATHAQAGTLKALLRAGSIEPTKYAHQHTLNEDALRHDLQFLHSRGYLYQEDDSYYPFDTPTLEALDRWLAEFRLPALGDPVADFATFWQPAGGNGSHSRSARARELLRWFAQIPSLPDTRPDWVAGPRQMMLGYLTLVLSLSLKRAIDGKLPRKGENLKSWLPAAPADVWPLFEMTGLSTLDAVVTELGERTLSRGQGPFGIAYSYREVLAAAPRRLRGEVDTSVVVRAENLAASQIANGAMFRRANKSVDEFCQQYGFTYRVYIEHALGRAEATRQRFTTDGETDIQYFGADLERTAIEMAQELQAGGELPQNMQFVANCDIGRPDVLLDAIAAAGYAQQPSVMVVGNGFHEIREITNDQMTAVFRAYAEAGIVLVFTEESLLSDQQLRETAWSTYHAGFRYFHAITGQMLRPSGQQTNAYGRSGWRECASGGGYVVVDEFTTYTRNIFPCWDAGINPPISVTYFCVPRQLAAKLDLAT